MSYRSPTGPPPRILDRRFGREASGADLTRHLAAAPEAFLEGALGNPALGPRQAVALLRNRRLTPAMLQRLARSGALDDRRVRKALVRHPRVPPSLAVRCLPELPWRDLAETAAAPLAAAPVRQQAEALLAERLDELSVGERIALARIAGPRVIAVMLAGAEAAVLCALLDNPRLTEADARRLAGRAVPTRVLATLAEHPRFGYHPALRLALACNPRTPIRSALGVVSRMEPEALRRLAAAEEAPRIVRVAADRARPDGSASAAAGRR